MLPTRQKFDHEHLRARMVREQLEPNGISDPLVLRAMLSVPRHLFVPKPMWASAYTASTPLPIGYGQTISQPFVVAMMSQRLNAEEGMSILEIGTGSGYQAAVLEAMGLEVFTVERLRELYLEARERFEQLGVRGVRMKIADGTLGWSENAPFDRILVTAGGPDIPPPLVEQLADPGVMIIPVGENKREQKLVRVVKENGEVSAKSFAKVSFVDLVGDHGW